MGQASINSLVFSYFQYCKSLKSEVRSMLSLSGHSTWLNNESKHRKKLHSRDQVSHTCCHQPHSLMKRSHSTDKMGAEQSGPACYL